MREPYTTVIIQSRTCYSLYGFGYGIGDYVPGAGSAWASSSETNLDKSGLWHGKADWLGLEWSVLPVTPAHFLSRQDLDPYPVTLDDLREFVGKAQICFFIGSRDPHVDYMVRAVDVKKTEFRTSQRILFKDPVQCEGVGRFWTEIRWPCQPPAPVFGAHPKDPSVAGALVVTFRLLEQVTEDFTVQRETVVLPPPPPPPPLPDAEAERLSFERGQIEKLHRLLESERKEVRATAAELERVLGVLEERRREELRKAEDEERLAAAVREARKAEEEARRAEEEEQRLAQITLNTAAPIDVERFQDLSSRSGRNVQ